MKKFFLELPNAQNTKSPSLNLVSINSRKVPVQNIPNSSGAKILDQSKDQHRAAGHRRRIDVRGGACWDFVGDWRRLLGLWDFRGASSVAGRPAGGEHSTNHGQLHGTTTIVLSKCFCVIGHKFFSVKDNFRKSSGLYKLCVLSIF